VNVIGVLDQRLNQRSWYGPALAGLIGGLAMTICLGPSLIDPTNVEWLMHADYRLHFLGFHLFRGGPWTWPLGGAPLLIWPIGSSIGLTDAIPLLAFPLKLIDPLLPPIFQFIGLWMVTSFALQGVFGALLMRLATPRPTLQVLGATFFVLSPPLIFRILHAALTAHWLVLAALWLSLRSDADDPTWRRAAAWALLVAASAAIQPYIMLMILVLMAAAHLRLVIAAPRRIVRITLQAAVSIGAAFVTLWQSGSLMVGEEAGLEIAGFGGWSTNLLAFIMPKEAFSRFAPGPIDYASRGQYEGYAYLGAGTLLLALVVIIWRVVAIGSIRWPRPIWRPLPLLAALLFLELMALGPTVTFGPQTVFRYHQSWWGPLTIFRTNGRMVWPLFYATTAIVLFTVSRFRPRAAVALLSVGLVAQAADVSGMVRYVRDLHNYGYRDPLQSRFWEVVPKHYERFVLVPTNLCQISEFVDYTSFSLLAGRDGLAINSGLTARYDWDKARRYCHDLGDELRDGMRTSGSLYIVRADLLERLAPKTRDQTLCTIVDGFGVCFSAESYDRWKGEFDLPRSRLPDLAEFMRFYEALDETYRTALGRGTRDVPAAANVRVEHLVRYLSYRLEGCDHAEAETKTLQAVAGSDQRGLCADFARDQHVPPADQTHAFAARLEDALRGRSDMTPGTTHIDLEGEAVWLQAYAQERTRGVRPQDASAKVFAAIRGEKP
jgi:uncharacterized protein DUF6311